MFRLKSWFSRRISEVSKRLKFPCGISGVLGGILVLFSVLVGIWASSLSEKSALLRWEKAHLPSLRVVSFAAQSRGMTPVLEVRRLQQCLRGLAVSFDEKGAFWISEDSNWVTFFSEEEEGLPHVYCLNCAQLPQKWSPVGIGWKGLEGSMTLIDVQIERVRSQKMSTKSQNLPSMKDPRAIEY